MSPFVCPRCGTLVNEVPATCRVCGTKLVPSTGSKGTQPPPSAQPAGSDSWMPWSSVGLLIFVIGTIVLTPGLAYVLLILLGIPIGSGVICAVAVALIYFIDRRASKRGNGPYDAGCLLILIGVAVVSGLFFAISLYNNSK